jgi:hypothetical protein
VASVDDNLMHLSPGQMVSIKVPLSPYIKANKKRVKGTDSPLKSLEQDSFYADTPE